MRRPAEECALHTASPPAFAAQLTAGNAVYAAREPVEVHRCGNLCPALHFHGTCCTQGTVGIPIGSAIGIRAEDDLLAPRLDTFHVVKTREIDIALTGDRIDRLQNMRRGTVHQRCAQRGEDHAVQRGWITGAVDEDRLLPRLGQRLGHTAHKGGLAAARPALEDQQIVQPGGEQLVVQRVKPLAAVGTEEDMG